MNTIFRTSLLRFSFIVGFSVSNSVTLLAHDMQLDLENASHYGNDKKTARENLFRQLNETKERKSESHYFGEQKVIEIWADEKIKTIYVKSFDHDNQPVYEAHKVKCKKKNKIFQAELKKQKLNRKSGLKNLPRLN